MYYLTVLLLHLSCMHFSFYIAQGRLGPDDFLFQYVGMKVYAYNLNFHNHFHMKKIFSLLWNQQRWFYIIQYIAHTPQDVAYA